MPLCMHGTLLGIGINKEHHHLQIWFCILEASGPPDDVSFSLGSVVQPKSKWRVLSSDPNQRE